MIGERHNEKLASIERKLNQLLKDAGEGKIIIHIKNSEITGVTKVEDERL